MRWLPDGYQLYVIAAQNCVYEKTGDYVFSSVSHLAFLIQSKLGANYLCLTTVRTRLTLLMVVVRRDVRFHVSNLRIDSVVTTKEPDSSKGSTSGGGLMDQYKVCLFML